MDSEINDTRTQPQRIVTLCPSVRPVNMVVESPKGTAMIANESPNTDNMLRLRGNSLL